MNASNWPRLAQLAPLPLAVLIVAARVRRAVAYRTRQELTHAAAPALRPSSATGPMTPLE